MSPCGGLIVAIVSMDLSALAGFTGYTNMMLAASRASRAAASKEATPAANTIPADVKTPWDTSVSTSDTARLVKAMQAKSLIDIHDSSFDKEGVSDDYKKLFALYKGLSTLQTLANAAADTKAPAGTLAGLNKRFQDGFAQITKYTSGLELDTLSLLTGPKQTAAKSTGVVSRSTSAFTSNPVVQGDAQASMPALENASPFTITVKRGNGTATNVNIDLSEMTGTRNIGNTINFINGKLAAAGIQTRLQRVDVTPADTNTKDTITPTKQYAVRVNGYASETVSFAASDTSTALYMANQGKGAGELRKLDVDGAAPATVYKAAIGSSDGDMNVKSTVVDGEGNVFVMGTTAADIGTQVNQSSSSDVMVKKYDSAGNLLWSKLLGATTAADGLALAVDSKGAAVIAGQITGKLGTAISAGGKDSLVVKLNSAGEEVFARQVGSALDDGATAITIGPDDAIYVGGQVKGKMAGAAGSIGGTDAYVIKYDTKGTRVYTRQFGTEGDDRVAAMTIDDAGDLVVATTEGGQGVVRKFSTANATSPEIWSQTLGNLSGGGAIAGLVAENGSIYVAGSTSNDSLTGGGATIATASSGGVDGFVFKLDDSGSSVASDFVTYLGTNGSDRINGLAVSNGRIFVAGDTKGTLPGATATHPDTQNAFAAEIDATGAQVWASQFGVTTGEGYGRGLAVDTGGASVLDALGLPKGTLKPGGQAHTITAQTTARAGDYFTIQLNDYAARKITIDPGETMTSLVRKLNSVLGLNGKASIARTAAGDTLKIEPKEGQTVKLKAGAGNLDALAGLGLSAGQFTVESDDKTAADSDALPTYALGLKASYSLLSTDSAATARSAIEAAMSAIRTAYRELTMDPALKKQMAEADSAEKKGKTGGTVPAYLQAQLANYNSGLQRLTGGSSTTSSLL
ncbi:hypothetical protein sos41_12880 [Alphaproteobacteria bacterium SO-S41]|nr:hypothetical protein sos41_12880 [Alphaproteobacteria bacterium SO-S41]